jgi:hypothetical protein
VEWTAFVVREEKTGPSGFLAFERIITVDDIATLEDGGLFVGYCSSLTLGCGF